MHMDTRKCSQVARSPCDDRSPGRASRPHTPLTATKTGSLKLLARAGWLSAGGHVWPARASGVRSPRERDGRGRGGGSDSVDTDGDCAVGCRSSRPPPAAERAAHQPTPTGASLAPAGKHPGNTCRQRPGRQTKTVGRRSPLCHTAQSAGDIPTWTWAHRQA